jgi:glycosyltransferase involved in cell wall biosynthesis
VITVHDLSFLFFPQNFRAMNRIYLKTLTRLSVRRARRIIAVSESTRRDLVHQYGLPPAKVDVVYNGVDAAFRPLPTTEVAAFRRRAGLPDRFLLFVGTLEPRKNVARLIEAYARLPEGRPPLLLVGGKGWLYDEIFARVEELNLTHEVRHVGYVPATELPLWFNAAELFVYPSLYEGFGLPALEAMACGTAVVASSASSLPEVVGEAGRLADPFDTEALSSAMSQVLTHQEQREELREAGLKQAQAFTWPKAARQTVGTYRQALGQGEGWNGV